MRAVTFGAGLLVAAVSAGAGAQGPDLAALRQQVETAERAFARSMADRDLAAFGRHLSDHAIFYGNNTVLRGKSAVIEGWKAFYDGKQAPFSWEPDQVEVLADGTLAHSTGPVRDPQGKRVSRFNSVWRQEAPGVWRVIFDKGQPISEAEKKLP